MMGLPLGFAQPLILLGLLSLPVLWWLLRLIPPRPLRIEFPPTRLLFDIKPKEDTPSRTPWWLTLLRLLLATLVILAAAGPLWNPPVATTSGADADRAPDRRRLQRRGKLGRCGFAPPTTSSPAPRPTTAASRWCTLGDAARDISLQPPAAARVRLTQFKPKPHAVERTDALPDDQPAARRPPPTWK